jgi:hypothetical protein
MQIVVSAGNIVLLNIRTDAVRNIDNHSTDTKGYIV